MRIFPLLSYSLVLILAMVLSGCLSGGSSSNNSEELTSPIQLSLTVNIDSAIDGNKVSVAPLGTQCTNNCSYNVSQNSLVDLTPFPQASQKFDNWSGDCQTIIDNVCQVSMTDNQSVTVTFSPKIQTGLSINISGQGTIGINELSEQCNESNCEYSIYVGDTYTLIASPSSEGESFISWNSPDCDDNSLTCVIRVFASAPLEINPTFTSNVLFAQLTLNFIGNGSGVISVNNGEYECDTTCDLILPKNSVITLNASPENQSTFTGWNECEQNNCQFTLTEMKSVDINFSIAEQISLTLNIEGQGEVQLTESNQSCSATCTFTVVKGKDVDLVAKPKNDYLFERWSNGCGSSALCTVNLQQQTNLTATFVPKLFDKNTNSLLITEPHGVNRNNYPLQFGRPFIKGEIPNTPEVTINGVAPLQQVNIKQRYSDGSVKHAIFNVILESLPAYSNLLLTFANTDTASINTPLTKEQLLADNFNFDAKMEFTFNESITVSARDMIENDKFEYWLKGSVATSILVQDHSINRLYDVGEDAHRSIRPLFFITFWPTINQYTIRYVVENINSETLQDQRYDIALSKGPASETVYTKEALFHPAKTRWTKQYWSSDQPKSLSIDHNVTYLTKTTAIPNFDTSRVVPFSQIDNDWSQWSTKSTDLYDEGLWQRAMPTTGGRQDIGLYPSWTVKWLFTGDWRHQEIAFKQSELATAWPIHIREGRDDVLFDYESSITGLGRILSMAPGARPHHWVSRPDWYQIKGISKVTPIKEIEKNLWNPDNAHHPDISSPQFLLSGDYFFLEEMLFSSSFTSSNNNAADPRYGRGETGSEGALYAGEIRDQAWSLRTRLHTYDILPDDMPEKAYHHYLTESAIAQYQGLYHLINEYPQHKSSYNFAKNVIAVDKFPNGQPSPIGQWNTGTTYEGYVRDTYFDISKSNSALAPWMQNFVVIALGRANELGFNTQSLILYAGQQLSAPFAYQTIPLEMFSAYVQPTLDIDSQWLTSWVNIYSLYNPDYVLTVNTTLLNQLDSEHGYYGIGMAAASYLQESENFDVLWLYMNQYVASKTIYDNNPKWALLPR